MIATKCLKASRETVPLGMVQIPTGEFVMGSNLQVTESPIHTVFIDSFWMDECAVTNSDFSAFVAATGYKTSTEQEGKTPWHAYAQPDRAHHPVVMVSWFDADAFANWAGKRLPTEAEWEKAATGSLASPTYPWGDADPDDTRVTWNGRLIGDQAPPTQPVRSYPPNSYGLIQMAGNVWEWCMDWYSDSYYAECPASNPPGPAHGIYRVRRGASWNVREAFRLRCNNRGALLPSASHINMGFRCARDL